MKIDRLMGILVNLLNSDKVTAPFLAEKFEVSIRTINRDIMDLCKAGIPIITLRGNNGGIMIDPDYKLDNKLFKKEEISDIYAGLKGLDSISKSDRYRLLIDKFSPSYEPSVDIDLSSYYKKALSEKTDIIQNAIKNNKTISFTYYAKKGKSTREVEPYSLSYKWSSWYLYCYCLDKEDFRLFKLNRMMELRISENTFNKREVKKQEYDIGNIYKNNIEALIIFDKSEEYRLVDEYERDSYTYFSDDKIFFTFKFHNKEFLFNWLLTFGDSAELIFPVNLRVEFGELIKKINKKYNEHDI